MNYKETLTRPDHMDNRNRWMNRLQHVFDGVPDDYNSQYVFTLDGCYGQSQTSIYANPEQWVDDCLADLASKAEQSLTADYFRPLCVECGIYGVHFVDKLLGAHVYEDHGQWQADALSTPIGELTYPDLENNKTWDIAKRAAQAFAQSGVTVPFFGMPTLSSPLNIAVNLYGEDILVEMMTQPEKAQKDLAVIAKLISDLHLWYMENIGEDRRQQVVAGHRTQPYGYGQICGCTTQLVSPSVYKELIAPLDESILSLYPHGGMIHLCGAHTQHMETFARMKSLRAIQLNDRAAADLPLYREALRPDQIIYLNPCEEMPLDKTRPYTKGGNVIIVDSVMEKREDTSNA